LVIYGLIEEAMADKQVALSDNGELRFSLMLKMGKVEVRKEIVVMLKEVSMDEIQKLTLRVQKLEKSEAESK
jgi:hypothetical protein